MYLISKFQLLDPDVIIVSDPNTMRNNWSIVSGSWYAHVWSGIIFVSLSKIKSWPNSIEDMSSPSNTRWKNQGKLKRKLSFTSSLYFIRFRPSKIPPVAVFCVIYRSPHVNYSLNVNLMISKSCVKLFWTVINNNFTGIFPSIKPERRSGTYYPNGFVHNISISVSQLRHVRCWSCSSNIE